MAMGFRWIGHLAGVLVIAFWIVGLWICTKRRWIWAIFGIICLDEQNLEGEKNVGLVDGSLHQGHF
jgi:hypothetical protein